MLFIGFGRERKPRKPSDFVQLAFEPVVRNFASGGLAKTYVKKIKDAETGLRGLAKERINPESQEYQKRLKELYHAKYRAQIGYWQACLQFARQSGASSNAIKSIESQIAKATKEFNGAKGFLK